MERENSPNPSQVTMPNIQFSGQNYEVGGMNAIYASIIGYLRMFIFFIMFAGDYFFNAIGGLNTMPDAVKDTYKYIQENKIQAGLITFFMGAVIQTNLMQSGAFEIYIDGQLQFSKLETKQMPTFELIQNILRNNGVNI